MSRFSGKICVVSGGSSGIGLTVAQRLHGEGAYVILMARNADAGEAASTSLGGSAEFIQCDIADPDQVEQAFRHTAERHGRIDCAFNNAGVTAQRGRVAESNADNWRAVMRTNVDGNYYCMKHELAIMSANGGGAIVNNSSCASIMAIPGQAAYVASKFAINGLTQAAAIEYAEAEDGKAPVRINAVAPGPTLGGMNSEERLAQNPEATRRKIAVTAMKRFARPDEIANAVLWLLSDEASYVTGVVMPVDAGYSAGKF
jgi:NAD(P)-dependent dehydrogenase (short-subunit alcohol dehydrogenase family)